MNNALSKHFETHDILRIKDAKDIGVSRARLAQLAKAGELQRVSQGTYALADSIPDELVLIAGRSQHIIFSHETALALHKLHNRYPERPSISIPINLATPRSIINRVKTYHIKNENHDLGKTTVLTFMGHEVPCYDVERTICDIIRSYARIDIETYTGALKNYAKLPTRDLPRLMRYAQALGISDKVKKALEVLI